MVRDWAAAGLRASSGGAAAADWSALLPAVRRTPAGCGGGNGRPSTPASAGVVFQFVNPKRTSRRGRRRVPAPGPSSARPSLSDHCSPGRPGRRRRGVLVHPGPPAASAPRRIVEGMNEPSRRRSSLSLRSSPGRACAFSDGTGGPGRMPEPEKRHIFLVFVPPLPSGGFRVAAVARGDVALGRAARRRATVST
jgi:hypothetical protein